MRQRVVVIEKNGHQNLVVSSSAILLEDTKAGAYAATVLHARPKRIKTVSPKRLIALEKKKGR